MGEYLLHTTFPLFGITTMICEEISRTKCLDNVEGVIFVRKTHDIFVPRGKSDGTSSAAYLPRGWLKT